MSRTHFVVAGVVALVTGVSGHAARAGDYTFSTIDPPDGSSASANAINDYGQIAISTWRLTSFVREPDGTFTQVTVPYSPYVEAEGISNSGQVSGTFGNTAPGFQGFLWNNGQSTPLNYQAPNGQNSTLLYGTSGSGLVLGQYYSPDPHVWSFFTAQNGTVTAVPFPVPASGSSTNAWGINDAGQIVGSYFALFPSFSTGFLLDQGHLTNVVPPGAGGSGAFGINDVGQIAGLYLGADRHDHGFVYTNGTYQTIDFPGATDTMPSAINDWGQVVGSYFDSAGVLHAFVAIPEPGTAVLLPTLGLMLLIRRRARGG